MIPIVHWKYFLIQPNQVRSSCCNWNMKIKWYVLMFPSFRFSRAPCNRCKAIEQIVSNNKALNKLLEEKEDIISDLSKILSSSSISLMPASFVSRTQHSNSSLCHSSAQPWLGVRAYVYRTSHGLLSGEQIKSLQKHDVKKLDDEWSVNFFSHPIPWNES